MNAVLWTIISLILIIIGVVASVFAGTTIVKDNTDNKNTAKKHWVYIIVGVLLIFIGFILMYFIVIKGLQGKLTEAKKIEIYYEAITPEQKWYKNTAKNVQNMAKNPSNPFYSQQQ